jgi:enolase-phosphatase E1
VLEAAARYIPFPVYCCHIPNPLRFLGLLWRTGYENGSIVCPLYSDVLPALKRWESAGKRIFIYSSGSIAAQKLLFAHTACEPKDLNLFFQNYYDTTNAGMKAAREAGMGARVVLREGNAPVTEEDKETYGAVVDFTEL